jgi:UDP-N-acetylmuramoyl-L-alanyl-D-glutamate--2,6-diaminopimelate ligase
LIARKVSEGSVFVAIKGTARDGHEYINTASRKRCNGNCLRSNAATSNEDVTYLQVTNSAEAVAYMAHNYYGQPSSKVELVGVTGTNGKTTIATLLYKVFSKMGYKCGLISTVQNQMVKRLFHQHIQHLMQLTFRLVKANG